MSLKTIKDIDLNGKKVLIRCDFNVPIKDGNITDDTRIKAALPTIKYVLDRAYSVILMSHLGRPKGERNLEYTLLPVAKRLSQLLNRDVKMLDDTIGPQVNSYVESMREGDIALLENVRFYKGETKNDLDFAKQLASLADVFVNDAFGTAHRTHASTAGIAEFLPSVAGFLIEREDKFLGQVLKNPKKPFVAIIGGSKVSSKIAVLESLLPKADSIIIAGGMSYTFLKVQGYNIGNSLVENDYLDVARSFLKKAESLAVKVILPLDHVVASEFREDAKPEYIDSVDISDGKIGMDVGVKTLAKIKEALEDAETVVWNGPLGVFEFDSFSKGTEETAKYVASCHGTTIVGGGDSVAAINKFNLADKITHVSTGGGATLEYLEGKVLPGIEVLRS